MNHGQGELQGVSSIVTLTTTPDFYRLLMNSSLYILDVIHVGISNTCATLVSLTH